jgi:CBS domain-containing protein
MSRRLIALMERDERIRLPEGAAYLALGSEGRGEQTMRTDQDSALVYRDDLGPEELRQVERFGCRLVDLLEEVGVPRCPGNTMASNPQWRHSLSEWKQLLTSWISNPESESLVNYGMFQDFRTLYGDQGLEQELREHILGCVKRNALFLPYTARHIQRFQPPLGMFGRIRVERRGESRGKIDIKKSGIFALTEGVTLLALEQDLIGGSTWEKLDFLKERGGVAPSDHETLEDCFSYLVHLRLSRQLRAMASGQQPSNLIDPLVMTDKERDRLRAALKGVVTLLSIIRERFKSEFIAR